MLLLLLTYVVLRALWKIDVHLISTLLSYIGFVIYKAHFCSERKTKPYNITGLLIEELNLRTI